MDTFNRIDGFQTTACNASDIRQIQLDAMREGMRRATELACEYTIKVDREAILAAAEQLTEKDL